MATSHGTPRARGPQFVHVHGLEVTEPALDLLLADGRELDGEFQPARWCVSRRHRRVRLGGARRALGLNDNEKFESSA
jgi:hypothetical protein